MINVDLGKMDYQQAWDLQKFILDKRTNEKIQDVLLLVEHENVFTIGKSGKDENILFPAKLIEGLGIKTYRIERGGDVTYHGPGQLVGYPIFNFKNGFAGIRAFIETIEDSIIETLKEFEIKSWSEKKLIGVWTDYGKICSIGIAVKNWISFHGFALNVNTDLSYFKYMNPCGLPTVKMTSMKEILSKELNMEEVKASITKSFANKFQQEIINKCLTQII
jgi:lipoate-protein ligase B